MGPHGQPRLRNRLADVASGAVSDIAVIAGEIGEGTTDVASVNRDLAAQVIGLANRFDTIAESVRAMDEQFESLGTTVRELRQEKRGIVSSLFVSVSGNVLMMIFLWYKQRKIWALQEKNLTLQNVDLEERLKSKDSNSTRHRGRRRKG